MSFASQIISSINNSDSNNPSTTSADSDIGFKSDINTQIKETTIPKPVSKPSTSISPVSSSPSPVSSSQTSSSYFNMTYILIFIAVVILLVLQRYNIGLFGYLGDILDNLINIVYDLFRSLYNLFKPMIDKINEILFGSIKSGSQTTAIGAKKLANENAELVDDLTDNIIEQKKIKINKKLEKDILKSNKDENIDDDEVDSSIQQPNNEWCYIGSDQNIRKCVKHGESICMSGLVFPTQEKCVNNV